MSLRVAGVEDWVAGEAVARRMVEGDAIVDLLDVSDSEGFGMGDGGPW